MSGTGRSDNATYFSKGELKLPVQPVSVGTLKDDRISLSIVSGSLSIGLNRTVLRHH